MIKIVAYQPQHFTALTSYALDEKQSQFSQTPQQILNNRDIMEKKERFQYTVLFRNRPAGFFSLDFSSDRFVYSNETDTVLLRSFSVNPHFQGKGIAKSVMRQLPYFVKMNFPETNKIVFGVNLKNEHAYQLYLKTGYLDSGHLYKGLKGMQHIMYRKCQD